MGKAAVVSAFAAALAFACGVGDIDDLTGGTRDAGAADVVVEADVDTGVDADTCLHAVEPDRPTVADGPSLPPAVFAISDVRLDSHVQNLATPVPQGLDLDHACTSCGAHNVRMNGTCRAPDASTTNKSGCDLDGGRDNALGDLFTGIAGNFVALNSTGLSDKIHNGVFTILLTVSNWNGTEDDPDIGVGLMASSGLQGRELEGGSDLEAKLDGTDVWRVDPLSLENNGSQNGKGCQDTVCVPAVFDFHGYVRGGLLVAHMNAPVKIAAPGGGSFTFDLESAVFTGHVTAGDAGVSHIQGEIAGRWGTAAFLSSLAIIRYPNGGPSLCGDSGIYQVFKSALCATADISIDPAKDNTDQNCDAVSAAIGFTGISASLGSVAPFPNPTGGDDCPPDWHDTCSP